MTIFIIQSEYASKASCLSQKTILDGDQAKNSKCCTDYASKSSVPLQWHKISVSSFSWHSITFFVFFVIFLFIVSC